MRPVSVALGPHYEEFINLEDEEAKLAALRAAIDEGDASGDVIGFDRDVFLSELKAQSHREPEQQEHSAQEKGQFEGLASDILFLEYDDTDDEGHDDAETAQQGNDRQ